MERFSREISLIGVGGLLKLKNSRVAVSNYVCNDDES